ATAARIMLSPPASPTILFRVARGRIAQECAAIAAPTSLADLLGALSGVFSATRADRGLSTVKTSEAKAFSEAFAAI
ncbi:MAG TPA: hypothetical protein VFY40_15800, partial [Blastocatellia bacterium]|nr:hypothetical protein [Blastocatellia bacterium]